MTPMSVAQKSSRAAKVLAAAEDLVVKQGFKGVTMSAVAQRAHVGKGTPYLYWNTKEDLFLEIIARSLADVLHNLAVRVRAEPALAVAERLCVALAKAWLERPLVRALQVTDADVLGALLDDPRAHAIAAESGPSAILRRLIPPVAGARHGPDRLVGRGAGSRSRTTPNRLFRRPDTHHLPRHGGGPGGGPGYEHLRHAPGLSAHQGR